VKNALVETSRGKADGFFCVVEAVTSTANP
jgi:hypothetical protein